MKFNYRLLVVVIICIAAASFLIKSEFFKNKELPKNYTEKVHVVTTFYPLGDFARHIVQEKGEVTVIIPAGTEPHDFDPTPQDLITLQKSQVFVFNGAGFEPWVTKVLGEGLANEIVVVDSSNGIELMKGIEGIGDPHIWLDPVFAQIMVENILTGVIQTDPQNRSAYENNAQVYKEELAALDRQFSQTFITCTKREFITSHAAFTYFAKRYNLIMVPIAGLSPDEEPSTKKLTEIVEYAKDKQLKGIFYETLVSSKLAETIAKEAGLEVLVLNPLEGLTESEVKLGKDYISVQRQNMLNLTKTLNCQ